MSPGRDHGISTAALDIEQPVALLDYLRQHGRIAPTETPAVRVLAGGVSNRTVRLDRPSGEAWVLKQALARLRVQVEWYSSPERIRREALGLHWLGQLAPGRVPTLLFEDPAQHLLAMTAVPEPHQNWKSRLLSGDIVSDHVRQFARLLATIHREARARSAALAPVFDDTTYFESLRLEPYYAYTATQVPAAADFLHQLIAETRSRRDTLVHGDYSPKNVLVHQGHLVLLDHEVVHWGDPAFDIGFSLTHFLSKAHHLQPHRPAFARAARLHWEVYLDGLEPAPHDGGFESRCVRHTLACLLARVAGRSPLEYLDGPARARQAKAVLRLLGSPPQTLYQLTEAFLACL